jgi:putative protease
LGRAKSPGLHPRVEFTQKSGDQVRAVTRVFADALAGRCSIRELTTRLQKSTPQGLTEGSLFVPEGYQLLPILK